MSKTVWKFKGKYKSDPEEAYKEITSLKEITPKNVVDLARNEDSVIHDDFEWNDEVAGEKFRIIQAKDMIRSFVLVEDKDETVGDSVESFEINSNEDSISAPKIRMLHRTSQPCTFAPTEFFLENQDEYRHLLNQAIAELESFKRRYSMIAELETVFEAINSL